jgi:hypothetical protein
LSLLLLAHLALFLLALLAFLLGSGTFRSHPRVALFLGLALSFFLFSTLSLETLLLFSPFALAFCLALFLLCSSPPAVLLFPCFLFFGLLTSRLSPCLVLFALLFLRCLELSLLLSNRRFLGSLLSRPVRTLFLFGLFLLPALSQTQSGTIN